MPSYLKGKIKKNAKPFQTANILIKKHDTKKNQKKKNQNKQVSPIAINID